MISLDRRKYSNDVGLETETLFKKIMQARGNTVIKSLSHDDIHKHIDFYVNGFGVDVKGSRHLNCIWLETVNVLGNNGWLNGDADFIAFDIVELQSFSIYKRNDLLSFTKGITETTETKEDFLKIYSRTKWGRKDQLIKCRYNDIKHLETQIIKYER
jgi:hypothetical protein